MQTWAPDLFEDAIAAVVDTGDVAGGNGNEEAANHFVNQETNYQFIKISHV